MPQPLPISDNAPVTHAWTKLARAHERRQARRHEVLSADAMQPVMVEHAASNGSQGPVIGTLLNLSSSGFRIGTRDSFLKPGRKLQVRLQLPNHAGISAFLKSDALRGATNEATVELNILRRIEREPGFFELGGTIEGLAQEQRDMLRLYLSTQPLAA